MKRGVVKGEAQIAESYAHPAQAQRPAVDVVMGESGLVRVHQANFVNTGEVQEPTGSCIALTIGRGACSCGCGGRGLAFTFYTDPDVARSIAAKLIATADRLEQQAAVLAADLIRKSSR